MVNMNPVTSSNIGAIGYDGIAQMLKVQFSTGKTYLFYDVPLEVYDQFLSAQSKGKFFAEHIRSKYTYNLQNGGTA